MGKKKKQEQTDEADENQVFIFVIQVFFLLYRRVYNLRRV